MKEIYLGTIEQHNFLKLMFNEGEMISLVKSKYDTSITSIDDCSIDEGVLLCINPLKDTRLDANVSAYRNFLIEVDEGSLVEQRHYIESLSMPYSACVYSGNKSLHYGICLDENLPSEHIYRYLYQWILNIVTKADQACKNPSRMIRFPSNARPETFKIQRLIFLKDRIKLEDLDHWLNKYPQCRPIVEHRQPPAALGERLNLPAWVTYKLNNGLDQDKGRNLQWFGIGCEFAKAGYNEEETLDMLQPYFFEERDFKYREWRTTILSSFKEISKGILLNLR